MKSIIKPLGVSLVLGCAVTSFAQSAGPKIDRVEVKFVGPASVSEQFIRSNIKTKAGSTYQMGLTQDDVHLLYGTGQFYNIRVSVDQADDGGVILTYIIQARPRISDIKVEGNNKLSSSKLKKKVTSKTGDPLDEQKLFSDVQEMKKLYEKYGLADTQVKYILNIDEATGHGAVTYHIEESRKMKITEVEFLGAEAFPQKKLRKEVKTRKRWSLSWLTGSGYFHQDDFDGDRDRLTDFYHKHGYLDFALNDVKLDHPATDKLAVKFFVSEGKQYHVGDVKYTGNKIFTDAEIVNGLKSIHDFQHQKSKLGAHGLPMDSGDVYTPEGLTKNTELVQDFYGSKGYIEISHGSALRVKRVPNLETGTMDLEYDLEESVKSAVQRIDIRGNLKTKDKVIRRELAINPGDTLDMVRVKISKQRLEGLQYFSKVEANPEPTDPPIAGKKNLLINVEEQNTGNFSVGAGISSVDSLVGFAEVSQSNFDLFHPPSFTGGGQKIRLRVQVGTKRQDYTLSYTEPWFLNRKLTLGVDLYRHQLNFESPNSLFDETRTGGKVGLTRALGSDFLIGNINYTIEDIGISLNQSATNAFTAPYGIPPSIAKEKGDHLFHRFGGSLAYDTRNSVQLPNHGQRSELTGEFDTGDRTFYKMELNSAWYFPGFLKGHVLEAIGRGGVADGLDGNGVPFYDRYYLGGMYSLRGFKFRNVSPREGGFNEPVGGNNYWYGSLEYSVPIVEKENGVSLRFAMFYDIGAVGEQSYDISTSYADNWGFGLRMNIPHLGPLRLDYGIPITTDKYNGSSGQFQFGVGYTHGF
jgi:outer membrane protein insertion porin family